MYVKTLISLSRVVIIAMFAVLIGCSSPEHQHPDKPDGISNEEYELYSRIADATIEHPVYFEETTIQPFSWIIGVNDTNALGDTTILSSDVVHSQMHGRLEYPKGYIDVYGKFRVASVFRYLLKRYPQYQWDVIKRSLDNNNLKSYPLDSKTTFLNPNVHVVSRDRYRAMPEWAYSSQYPLIRMLFSRAGFDESQHVALVFYASGWPYHMAKGCIVLRKAKNEWGVIHVLRYTTPEIQ